MLIVLIAQITVEQVWRRERERKAARTEAPRYANSGETSVQSGLWHSDLQTRQPTAP